MPTSDVECMTPSVYWTQSDGLFLEPRLQSLGVVHGVSGRSFGDMKERANRRKVMRRAGLSGDPLLLEQIHGARVHRAISCLEGEPGDGWITDTPSRSIGIFVADCVPLFLWDKKARVFGIFHAGWKGLAAGMVASAVQAFDSVGVSSGDLSAAIGPHIGACCYEVGAELAEHFLATHFSNKRGRRMLDLGAFARDALAAAGIGPEKISVSANCTSCQSEDFFSFRREGKMQRMLAFISVPT